MIGFFSSNPRIYAVAFGGMAGQHLAMSPTIFRSGELRFFFFSREESRLHVHVQSPDGEAKFWLEPVIALAQNHGLKGPAVYESLRLIRDHEQQIRRAWHEHFGR